eukprot:6047983-Prymnesium_polylepis.1
MVNRVHWQVEKECVGDSVIAVPRQQMLRRLPWHVTLREAIVGNVVATGDEGDSHERLSVKECDGSNAAACPCGGTRRTQRAERPGGGLTHCDSLAILPAALSISID